MEKKVRFRILNKTAKTVTIKIGDKPTTVSWDDYNKTFVTVDKFWAEFNEEEQKRHDQAEEALTWAVIHFLAMRTAEGNPEKSHDYLVNALGFGKRLEEIQNLLNCTPLEAAQLVQKRLMVMNPFLVNPMFSEETLNRNGIQTKKRLREKVNRDADGNREVVSTVDNKPTLGDAFSCLGDLKKKMEEE